MKVGIQLFSVRDAIAEDAIGTLEKIAEMGYKYWEPAPYFFGKDKDMINRYGLNMTAKDAKKFIGDHGVKIVGTHVDPLTVETYPAALDYFEELGNRNVGFTGDHFSGLDDLKQKCELYNKIGEIAKSRNMVFYYHNHYQEWQKFEGKFAMDWILELTDPKLVKFELDNFWCARGGADPVKVAYQTRDRLILMHQKDFGKNANGPLNLFEKAVDPNGLVDGSLYDVTRRIDSFAEVGTGVLPIQDYIDVGNELGVPYILLEQDWSHYSNLESVQMSMNAFKKYKGIEWD